MLTTRLTLASASPSALSALYLCSPVVQHDDASTRQLLPLGRIAKHVGRSAGDSGELTFSRFPALQPSLA